jgi:hypothetical protein
MTSEGIGKRVRKNKKEREERDKGYGGIIKESEGEPPLGTRCLLTE